MAYRLHNKMGKEEGTLCADRADAVGKLEAFLDACRARGYTIEEHMIIGDEFPSYLIHDEAGQSVGDFTISYD